MFRPSSGVLVLGLTLSAAIGFPWPIAQAAKPTPFSVTTSALADARNEKVRVQAALVLGRTGDERAIPFLMQALADRSPLVRAMSAKSLGDLRAESARDALDVARQDPSPLVRRHAELALQRLARATAAAEIEVNAMGDKTRIASMALREKMRAWVSNEMSEFKGKPLPGLFAIDGSIRILETSTVKDTMEVKCDVQLILSTRPGKSIVMMSSGQAVVQRPRRLFRPAILADMQSDALKHAVRGAADELRSHLTNRLNASAGARMATPP